MQRFLYLMIMMVLSTPVFNQSTPSLFVDLKTRNLPDPPALMGVIRTRYAGLDLTALSVSDLTLNLFEDATFQTTKTASQPRPSGEAGYVWTGELVGKLYSRVVLVVSPDGVFGQVNTLNGGFAIETVAPGVVAISEVSGMKQHDHLERDADPMPVTEAAVSAAAPRETGQYIDVMVVYTPAATAQGDITAKIDSMVAVTNQTYADSGVYHRIRLVHTAQVEYLEDESMTVDRNRLTYLAGERNEYGVVVDAEGYLDEVQLLRDQYLADLVVLVTNGSAIKACGLGWVLGDIPNAEKFGVSVVNVLCWSPYFTFTHELGHNMGGSHDPANEDGLVPFYPYGYGYQDPDQQFVTVMAKSTKGNCPPDNDNIAQVCTPIGRWSNPAQTYNQKPLGTSTTDMVQTLNNTAVIVSSFRLAALQPFNLIAPANQSTVTDPAVDFQWYQASDAGQYILKVSTASGYRYKATVTSCVDQVCSFNPADDPLWKPPHNQVLRWKVIAVASGDRRISSIRWRFQADFLPDSVEVDQPVKAANEITFSWQDNNQIDDFKLKVIDPNGIALYKRWNPSETICIGGRCSVKVMATITGIYKWRVIGRRDGVAGRIRSPKMFFTFDD